MYCINVLESLYSPLLNLSISNKCPLYISGISVWLEGFIQQKPALGSQRLLPNELRSLLTQITNNKYFSVFAPYETDTQTWTIHWKKLCNQIIHYPTLSIREKACLLYLLISLGFYDLVLCLNSTHTVTNPEEPEYDHILFAVLLAEYSIATVSNRKYPIDKLIQLENTTIPEIGLRVSLLSLVYFAKVASNTDVVLKLARGDGLARKLERLDSDFKSTYFLSRIYRATSYAPFLEKEYSKALETLQLCEDHARNLIRIAKDSTERIIALENLVIALQSKAKLYITLGSIEEAIKINEERLVIDPFDDEVYLDQGILLTKIGRIQEAKECLSRASMLGATNRAYSLYLLAQLTEEKEQSFFFYNEVLRVSRDRHLSCKVVKILNSLTDLSFGFNSYGDTPNDKNNTNVLARSSLGEHLSSNSFHSYSKITVLPTFVSRSGIFSQKECNDIRHRAISSCPPLQATSCRHFTIASTGTREAMQHEVSNNIENEYVYAQIDLAVRELNKTYWNKKISGMIFPLKLLVYNAKQFARHTWHVDSASYGNVTRLLTVIVQMSIPGSYEGGRLEFNDGRVQIASQEIGTLIIFPCEHLHQVTPLIRGTRYALFGHYYGES